MGMVFRHFLFFALVRKLSYLVFPIKSNEIWINKDENAHRFALSAIREELLERKGDCFGILYSGYLLILSIVKIKRERAIEVNK